MPSFLAQFRFRGHGLKAVVTKRLKRPRSILAIESVLALNLGYGSLYVMAQVLLGHVNSIGCEQYVLGVLSVRFTFRIPVSGTAVNQNYNGKVNGIYDTIINCLFSSDSMRFHGEGRGFL